MVAPVRLPLGFPAMQEEQPKAPLRERPWFIAVMMLVVFPYGLVIFWRHDAWDYRVKWLVTIIVFVTVIWALGRLEV